MRENTEIKHSPLTYAIYNKLHNDHAGQVNAISADDLAAHFGIDKRFLRLKIHEMRDSNDFELCIMSGNGGYWVAASRDEYKQANKRLYRQAFSILRCARANERKASKHNQGRIIDFETEFADFFKSFMEDIN